MEAKVEIVEGVQFITCGSCKQVEDELWMWDEPIMTGAKNLDELYAVLHAREVAKQWQKAESYLHGVVELAEKNGIEVKHE